MMVIQDIFAYTNDHNVPSASDLRLGTSVYYKGRSSDIRSKVFRFIQALIDIEVRPILRNSLTSAISGTRTQ